MKAVGANKLRRLSKRAVDAVAEVHRLDAAFEASNNMEAELRILDELAVARVKAMRAIARLRRWTEQNKAFPGKRYTRGSGRPRWYVAPGCLPTRKLEEAACE